MKEALRLEKEKELLRLQKENGEVDHSLLSSSTAADDDDADDEQLPIYENIMTPEKVKKIKKNSFFSDFIAVRIIK
jgi:hypothetical protein